jgi:hypothetical protein
MKVGNIIRSEVELRALMGGPIAPPVVEKTLSSLDRHCLTFLKSSPFVLISSSNAGGGWTFPPRAMLPAS